MDRGEGTGVMAGVGNDDNLGVGVATTRVGTGSTGVSAANTGGGDVGSAGDIRMTIGSSNDPPTPGPFLLRNLVASSAGLSSSALKYNA